MGIEVYADKPVLYGCGDFLNDYEGIGGHEAYRSDLCLMYFVTLDRATGRLSRLQMTPMRIGNFRLNRASFVEASWLAETMDRESTKLGTGVELVNDRRLSLGWGKTGPS